MDKTLVVGISGSSGAILGIRLLEVLWSKSYETHLIVTSTAERIIEHDTKFKVKVVSF